jgi:hypothetical protein
MKDGGNSMRSFVVVAVALFLMSFGAGCSRSPGGIAASNIPLQQGGYTPIGKVAASDCKVNLLGIIPVSGGNYIQDAVGEALQKSGGHALVDISIEQVSKFFILWSQTCTEVRATAVRLD